jgi:hypothetical protein
MGSFPENEVAILPDYFPVAPAADVAEKLVLRFESEPPFPQNFAVDPDQTDNERRAREVFRARRRLHGLLTAAGETLTLFEQLTEKMTLQRDFEQALGLVDKLRSRPSLAAVPRVDRRMIELALTPKDITFTGTETIIKPGGEDNEIEIVKGVRRTLRGYKGEAPSQERGELLPELDDFLTGRSERTFRLHLLRAECLLGQARAGQLQDETEGLFREAMEEYRRLLPSKLPGRTGLFLSRRQQFIVIRFATAKVALSDFLFRRAFRVNEEQVQQIADLGREALTVMKEARLNTQNPAVADLFRFVDQQGNRLASRSYLGYADSFVPNLRLETLSTLAKNRIDAAKDASGQLDRFETEADAVVRQKAELDQEELEDELGVKIASERVNNARSRREAAQKQVDFLNTKAGKVREALTAGVAKSVFATLALGPGGVQQFAGTVDGPGLVSAVVGYRAALAELEYQRGGADLEKQIAGRDERIAALEHEIALSRVAYVQESLQALTFRAKRLFALVNAYDQLTRRHMTAALEFLYLYERAIAFRRLIDPQIVQDIASDPLFAPADLGLKLNRLNEIRLPPGEGQNAIDRAIPLRLRYPIEFAQFLQTGEMEFVISLYDLERHLRLNGHSNVRIKKITVEADGMAPATGFIGTLVHRGVMMFRDLSTITPPRPARFIPTLQELDDAVRKLRNGRAQRVVVGGVALLAAEEDRRRFTSEPDISFTEGERDFELEPMENYSVTGTWFLKIEGINVRKLTDVTLKFFVSLDEQDPQLADRVDELIAAYEDELRMSDEDLLDRIHSVSLTERSVFLDLETGAAAFDLRESDFEQGLTDLKVKTVVAQARDSEGRGVEAVELEILKPEGSFLLSRTTGPGGFSEDVSGPIPMVPAAQRPDIHGEWQVRLGTGQFLRIEEGDLMLFFVYEFRRAG